MSAPVGPPNLPGFANPSSSSGGGRRIITTALTCLALLLLICSGGCYACFSLIRSQWRADVEESQEALNARLTAIEQRLDDLAAPASAGDDDAGLQESLDALREDVEDLARQLEPQAEAPLE